MYFDLGRQKQPRRTNGEGVMAGRFKQLSKWELTTSHDIVAEMAVGRTLWTVPALLCCMRYSQDPKYLTIEKTIGKVTKSHSR